VGLIPQSEVASVLAGDSSGARAYESYPLTGSPARRLMDDVARLLREGAVARCPHPGEQAFWYLPARMLACAPCVGELAGGAAGTACEACGAPATAVAAWVAGDVPCIAGLCGRCHEIGLVPVAPN